MSRAERVCRTLPDWMLRQILAWPSWRNWWTAAWLELWDRAVQQIVDETADTDAGPWPSAMPPGMH